MDELPIFDEFMDQVAAFLEVLARHSEQARKLSNMLLEAREEVSRFVVEAAHSEAALEDLASQHDQLADELRSAGSIIEESEEQLAQKPALSYDELCAITSALGLLLALDGFNPDARTASWKIQKAMLPPEYRPVK